MSTYSHGVSNLSCVVISLSSPKASAPHLSIPNDTFLNIIGDTYLIQQVHLDSNDMFPRVWALDYKVYAHIFGIPCIQAWCSLIWLKRLDWRWLVRSTTMANDNSSDDNKGWKKNHTKGAREGDEVKGSRCNYAQVCFFQFFDYILY